MAKKKTEEDKNPFEAVAKEMGNEYMTLLDDGTVYDCDWYIDTGSYLLNGLLSGSIWWGLPGNRITALAGEQTTGKTYLLLEIMKNFLNKFTGSYAFIFETEGAINRQMLVERGIDPRRVYVCPVTTVEEFKTQAVRLLSGYMNMPEDKRPKMMLGLDSLGNMSTLKEMDDTEKGNFKKDMTRAPGIKGAFRVLTLRCARAGVPMIITNHVYDVIGAYIPTKDMSGGGGLKFAASSIVFLSKKKMKDEEKHVIGGIITANMIKSRYTREYSRGELGLSFETGLDRYYGLFDFGIEHDVIVRDGNSYIFPGGVSATRKEVEAEPEKYFTEEVLKVVDAAIKQAFSFGNVIQEVENVATTD